MRVVVTGGAGFIGSNLVVALIGAGHEVLVIDDLSSGDARNLDPRADTRTLDIRDPACAESIVRYRPQWVVHLAAQSSVPASIADPARDRSINVDGTRAIARAARDAGSQRLIFASSAAVYGEPEVVPLPETAEKRPTSPYGRSKLDAEAAVIEELQGSGTDLASLRFANVYGPRQDAAGEGGVVAVFCDRIRRGEPPVIYGDGSQTRDFIYVADVVGAIIAALEHQGRLASDGADGPAFNISTGQRTSVLELVGALRAASGYTGPVRHEPARAGDILHSALDPAKAEAVFGWRASVPLETGVGLTWRWFASQHA